VYVLECLKPDYDITLFFFNPNIEPYDEYDKRKKEVIKLLEKSSRYTNVKLIERDYGNDIFNNAVSSHRGEPEGSSRCQICFELRLKKTAMLTAAGFESNTFDIFATTLTVSPHKNAEVINLIGCRLANEYNTEYLMTDFKKKNGYIRSVELSKQYDLYRQNYCGCK